MSKANTRILAGSLALSLGLALSACGGAGSNTSLYSTNQPVVERTNYTFDVRTNSGGVSYSEQQRVTDWFDAMDLRYGDRIAIDDPMASSSTRDAIAQIAARKGILLSEGAPVTAGYVEAGQARIVLTRSTASVPNCPNWSDSSDMNYENATSRGYGCATNGNLAAMIANPEDLINGQQGTGETVVSTSTKAIESYRKQAPSGEGGLIQTSSGE